jgi:hypothetical protein
MKTHNTRTAVSKVDAIHVKSTHQVQEQAMSGFASIGSKEHPPHLLVEAAHIRHLRRV